MAQEGSACTSYWKGREKVCMAAHRASPQHTRYQACYYARLRSEGHHARRCPRLAAAGTTFLVTPSVHQYKDVLGFLK
jgi:hypothetical protein